MAVPMDFATKNVLQELLRECTNKSIQIPESFILYYVKLLLLNPSWGILPGTLPHRNDVRYLVKQCVQKLSNQSHSSIVTLKIQHYFKENFENLENMIIKNRADLKARILPLEKDILDAYVEDEEGLGRLFRKVVYFITLTSGLGNPTDEQVYKESAAALKSALLETDLKEFVNETRENKEYQLIELTELVTGIRLFNRDCKKCGSGIEDLPKMLTKALEVTLQDIEKTLESIMETVNLLTTAVDNNYEIEPSAESYVLRRRLPDNVDEPQLNHVMNLLIIYRQYELFVRKILVEVSNMSTTAKSTIEKLKDLLSKVHNSVSFRTAIPTIQVFPLFSQVADAWYRLQNQTIALSQLNQMLLNLHFEVERTNFTEDVIRLMLGPSSIISDADRLEKTTQLKIRQTSADAPIVYPSDVSDFERIELQYLGFCAWKFVETGGGLIPANPNMGVLRIDGKYYAFCCPEAAVAFCSNPFRNILRGLEVVRRRCELINLLQMEDQLIKVSKIEQLVVEIPQPTSTCEVEAQTDLHPNPTYIDPSYMWNIWDWKRQAILYANLSRCITCSTQTTKSRAREATVTQTYDTKHASQQTKRENYSNVPTVSSFIYGLRGRLDDLQHVITLTRPVDE
ncbi:hypothetical protein PPYR_06609 [Photinus pyralis]|uniref:Cilia- and flagella-associated protein 206 n=2 Tax=Photinus pyralis TaxID=7054 RepID=A0A5N4AN26_PHOPY|nr:cilia- and flagella-associated protein 206-like isoform X2 [Photinus pyralis]XP_031339580.1 cilia- and flagella-associated protein 206-like isoform X2 [Photinus pyralis]KAB0798729.1 hypothetical protein PPYR_06609 [Photinus pyralis]